jgi:hypothetical protein
MSGWPGGERLKKAAVGAGAPPAAPGLSGSVTLSVTGGAGGDADLRWCYHDGIPGECDGAVVGAADLVLSVGSADAWAVAAGEMDPSVAYMRGRLKASGNGALLLGLLASTATEDYRSWRPRVMRGTGQSDS